MDINEQISEENKIDLLLIAGDFWKGLKKFWWLCLILAVLGGAGFYIKTVKNYVPMYKAEASFTVTLTQSSEKAEENSTYNFYYNSSTASQMAKTFPYILQSDMLTGIVREQLGVSSLNGSISASAVENSNLFTIQVESSSPEDALSILQSVIDNYPSISKYVIGDSVFNMIQPASLPENPYNTPNYKKQAAKGALAGLFTGLALILIYACSRTTIRKPEDCKNKLNIESLGEIPVVHFRQRKRNRDRSLSIYNDGVGSSFREAMRTLSVRVMKKMSEKGASVLMVTSTVPGEGKSVIALNLAYCLAKRGMSVILVDTNLRQPTIRRRIAASDGRELSELMTKGGQLEEYLCKGQEKMPDILGNLQPAEKSTGRLNARSMQKLLNVLREQYDYIILDTASTESASDSLVLAEYTDMVLYVVKQDEAKMWDIMDGISVLGSGGTSICGCVLSHVKSGIEGYGYGYGRYGYGRYGRYGYSYNYGYGHKKYGYGSHDVVGGYDAGDKL